MAQIFLRETKAKYGECYSIEGQKCYFKGKRQCVPCAVRIVFIEDTTIPQKLALYDEIFALYPEVIKKILESHKKIEVTNDQMDKKTNL